MVKHVLLLTMAAALSACGSHETHTESYKPASIDENELTALELARQSPEVKHFIAKYARSTVDPLDVTSFDIMPDKYEVTPSDDLKSPDSYDIKDFACDHEFVISITPANFNTDFITGSASDPSSTLFNIDPRSGRVRVGHEDDDSAPTPKPTPCIDGSMPSPPTTPAN